MNMQASAPVGAAVGSPVMDALAAAAAAVAGVQDGPVYGLCDADLEAAIEQAQVLCGRVFDATLTLVREADERDLGRRLGAASTAAWLAGRYRIRPGQARTMVRLANQTRRDDGPVDWSANVRSVDTGRELRQSAAALADGAISAEHVMVVAKVMERIPDRISAQEARTAEAELAGFCRQHDPNVVAKLGDYLLALMAEETLDDAENERHRRRSLRLNEATGGISGTLTREGMALLRTALDPLAAPNPGSDGDRDPRTPGQRLVDALVELARRAIAANSFEHNHGISHRVLVTIGLDALTTDHQHDNPAPATTTNGANSGHTTSSSTDDGTAGSADSEPGSNVDQAPGRASADHRSASSGSTDDATADSRTTDTSGGSRDADTSGDGAEPPTDADAQPDTTTSGDPDLGGVGNAGTNRSTATGHRTGDPATGHRTGGTSGGRTVGGDGAAMPPFTRGNPTAPGQIHWGGLISPAATRRLACCAVIQRILLDPAGAVLDVGREYRTATPAQFAALIARDRGCAFPGCTRPACWCIAHHIVHWADGGPTDLDNLVLLCTWHHTVVHHHGWDVRLGPDRLPDFYPPPWVDPDREPQRNRRPRYRQTTTVIAPDR